MTLDELRKLTIVSRGKLRADASALGIAKVQCANGKSEDIITRSVENVAYEVPVSVWDALIADADFKARFDALLAERAIKQQNKKTAERETRDAEFIANAKVFKAIA